MGNTQPVFMADISSEGKYGPGYIKMLELWLVGLNLVKILVSGE